MTNRLTLTATALLALLLWAAATAKAAEAGLDLEAYSVLWERNIFSRHRGRSPEPKAGTTAETKTSTIDDPRADYILTGVVQSGGEWTAFLEDRRSGASSRLRTGEKVAGGTITSIAIDHIEFEAQDESARVELGENLAGNPGEPVLDYESVREALESDSGGTAPSEGGARPLSEEQAAVLEELKRKRERQVK